MDPANTEVFKNPLASFQDDHGGVHQVGSVKVAENRKKNVIAFDVTFLEKIEARYFFLFST